MTSDSSAPSDCSRITSGCCQLKKTLNGVWFVDRWIREVVHIRKWLHKYFPVLLMLGDIVLIEH